MKIKFKRITILLLIFFTSCKAQQEITSWEGINLDKNRFLFGTKGSVKSIKGIKIVNEHESFYYKTIFMTSVAHDIGTYRIIEYDSIGLTNKYNIGYFDSYDSAKQPINPLLFNENFYDKKDLVEKSKYHSQYSFNHEWFPDVYKLSPNEYTYFQNVKADTYNLTTYIYI